MNLQYVCPHWGQEAFSAAQFLDRVQAAGYDGVEINLPEDPIFLNNFRRELGALRRTTPDFRFIAQCIIDPVPGESVVDFLIRYGKKLDILAELNPDFINAHTGKDYFSFSDNCRAIESAAVFSDKSGIRVLHETHRGRFSFHAPTLMGYLQRFPEIELVADYTHFCTVSESLLQGQEELLSLIAPHVGHLHARIGFEQGPQVNDPRAPEWATYLDRFTGWWRDLLTVKSAQGLGTMTITPEFGPAPYMPALPYTLQPTGDQWVINQWMREHLRTVFMPPSIS